LATPTSLPQLPTGTATPYTLEGYQKEYATTVSNFKTLSISEATLRSVYLNQIYREKLMAEITKDTPRMEEQVLARHILVPDAGLAATIEAELAHGQDFAELAKKYSQDTGSAVKGGELDWSTRDTFVKEFADAAFSQPIGEISQPVKSQYGYHIIQVIARENLPVNDSQYEQIKQKAFTDWLTKLHDDTQTAKNITIDADTWKANIPALPASVQQLLQQQAAPQ
jgi:parvulin-like peptidyl-prolyl isomerase